MCFLYAGGSIDNEMPMHALAAASLNQNRKSLQKILHADDGTEAERDEISPAHARNSGLCDVRASHWVGDGKR
jgi:hypothetical protein